MGNQKIALIISGAPHHEQFDLHPYAEQADFIICADHGYDYAHAQGIVPDLFVGDGDSCLQLPDNCKTVVLPKAKDDTDTLYAVKTMLERGYLHLVLVCATGGRIDHMLCNCSLCEYVHNRGGRLEIVDACNHLQFLRNNAVILAKDDAYKYFSVIPLDATLQGVTIRGAVYPLENATIKREEIYSVSNEYKENTVHIAIKEGSALILRTKDSNSGK